jgi:prolyl-tRNA synthetase
MQALKKNGIRSQVDNRPNLRPGAKYFEWERKGVPLRIEIGKRETVGQVAVVVRRCGNMSPPTSTSAVSASIQTDSINVGKKHTTKEEDVCEKQIFSTLSLDSFASEMQHELDSIHKYLLQDARSRLAASTRLVSSYGEMKAMLLSADIERARTDTLKTAADHQSSGKECSPNGFFLAPWHCNAENEAAIKAECKATIRCYPLEHNRAPPEPGVKCFYSGKQATHMALFARAF